MRIVDFSADMADPISRFNSERASSVALGHGDGEVHVYAVYFDAGGIIGTHPTGYCQLFLAVQGRGWVAGEDGVRVSIEAGQGAYFDHGESHAKGSEEGLLAIMVQATHIRAEG